MKKTFKVLVLITFAIIMATILMIVASASAPIPGDVNGDGKATVLDSITIMQYLAGANVSCNYNALDVNGDKVINKQDVSVLLQYVVGIRKEANIQPACAHTLVAQSATVTCTEDGFDAHWKCITCQVKFKDNQGTIAVTEKYLATKAEGHKEEILPAVAPTCTTAGLTEGKYCKVCLTIFIKQETTAIINHIVSDWIVDKAATASEDGARHTECTMCKMKISEEILPATGSVGLAYEINSDNKSCTITGIGTCTDSKVVIPETVDGYTVTAIARRAFYNCASITEITIPSTVTDIGLQVFYKASNLHTVYYNSSYSSKDNAFLNVPSITKVVFGCKVIPSYILYRCPNIKEVIITPKVSRASYNAFEGCNNISLIIEDGVTSIANRAFEDIVSITSVIIPESVTSIGDYAFKGCKNLSVTITSNVKKFGYSALSYCKNITLIIEDNQISTDGRPFSDAESLDVIIQEGVTSIDKEFFASHSNLLSVTIPKSLTSIGDRAFDRCTGLKAVYISDIAAWCNIDFGGYAPNNPLYYAKNLYLNNQLITDLVIPDSVTKIGSHAFQNCINLISITIPNSVTIIGMDAFSGCTSLNSITMPDSVSEIGYRAFSGCTSLNSITIPANVTKIYADAFRGCTNLTHVYIPYGVTSIDGFSDCTSLTSINIPDSVTKIGSFSGCTSLTSINIPDGVTEIGSFSGCTSLTSINIPDSVTKIGSFSGCTSLTSINIPDGVTEIGIAIFEGCTNLTSITIPDSVNVPLGDTAFLGCTNLTSVIIGNGVPAIGRWTFQDCYNLKKVVIGENVKSIGPAAFNFDYFYSDFELDIYITNVDAWYNMDFGEYNHKNALFGRKNLYIDNKLVTSIVIPDNVIEISGAVFTNCKNLNSVTIPDSVMIIGDYAFFGCENLTSIIIPDSVHTIGDWAFTGCENLTSITIPDSVLTISEYAFKDCGNLTSITIPDSVITIGKYAFNGCNNLTSITIPNSITNSALSALIDCYFLKDIYYTGTEAEWQALGISSHYTFKNATIHYNS